MDTTRITRVLAKKVDALSFAPPVTHVYNPLVYARNANTEYLTRYAAGQKEVVFVGMNPGPWGMAQTGVPFGDITMVRDWMGIEAQVSKPEREHPKRPINGFDCPRSEVSGSRFWGWARQRFGTPENFFARFFVWNYCPLCFMEESGRNFTPEKLPAHERRPLFQICDAALAQLISILNPAQVIGIGKFAEDRCRVALKDVDVSIGRILHPSPASPAANRGWAEAAEKQLRDFGISLP